MGSGQAIGAWNAHGACIWDQVLDNFVISSPAVGDFDRDGHVEVAIATGSEEGGGSFYVFDCGAYTGTVADDKRIMPWPQFRENAQRTGEIPTGNEPLPPPGPANFHEYILVQNPCKVAAHADIELMTDKGVHKHVPLTVGPCSRSTVFVNKYMPGTSVSAAITSDWPVICERSMYFNYRGNWTGGHDVVGATAPSTDFYFAEGTCRPNFNPFICIQNPGDIVAKVTLSYMKGDGSTATGRIDVAPGSRCTVSPRDTLGVGDNPAHDFSTRVQCTNGQKIIAERAMYFNYQGNRNLNWTGGHDVVGAVSPARTFYFAEGTCRPGFDSYIYIQNPGGAPRPGHPHYHERRRHHRVAAAHRGLKLEGDSGPRKDARERQRCRSRLLNQHHLHQRTADNRRAPDVLQLQRGLDRRARRRGGGRRLGGLVLRRGIYGHLASADQAVPPFV